MGAGGRGRTDNKKPILILIPHPNRGRDGRRDPKWREDLQGAGPEHFCLVQAAGPGGPCPESRSGSSQRYNGFRKRITTPPKRRQGFISEETGVQYQICKERRRACPQSKARIKRCLNSTGPDLPCSTHVAMQSKPHKSQQPVRPCLFPHRIPTPACGPALS